MTAKTPLYDWHARAGGKLVDFAGWWLPVSYQAGQIAEHLATRKHGGLFDISHMGRFAVRGPQALPWLSALLTNDPRKLTPGKAQYTLISDPAGRPLDDAYLYQQKSGQYLLVVNAANRARDLQWLQEHLSGGVEFEDHSARLAMLAVQGPDSEQLLASLLAEPLPPPGRNHGGFNRLGGVEMYLSRTGYTGEPLSFELFPPWDRAEAVWEKLAQAGAPLGVMPVGLGARDTLRLEACLPLYGHEYQADRPVMAVPTARLGVDLNPERGEFMGRRALEAQARALASGEFDELPQRVFAVAALAKGMMREGSEVLAGGEPLGELTSATTIPAWRFEGGRPGGEHYVRPLGLALLDSGTLVGREVEIIYRKRTLPGRVVKAFTRPAGRYLEPIEFDGGEK
ncbi:MAG: glycine cleavage system aminomethyltransferase GcvT [Proteobacteria bacterium]|nr:glycine cleavage system aminomethyltransferase GcvT [Pseudomonadota bacterium]MBU1452758.1 glycine cleavage system aminomethyltransferase GcvT [Pseudomonadota bacterium]MBU2467028.1 glycine cleavage system aminomethyltransferase GcvT [Pseudomonadota bacterium]MBU2519422.1 glycine cleavage system aminomethyltransferase GcvT [Pseudomonadota bacterium]